ncbi:MAG: hypothetical protein WCA20_15980 [Candidatus Sulfotelmatobacter sp.]
MLSTKGISVTTSVLASAHTVVLKGLIDAQRRAEEEQANRESLRAIQRAFREAMLALPPEEYDWFDIQSRSPQAVGGGELPERRVEPSGEKEEPVPGVPEPSGSESAQVNSSTMLGLCARS